MQKEQREEAFAGSVWAWYKRWKRTLPWRDLDIRDDSQRAYLVLVSEVMLQQTQVPRVIGAFKRFTERFPTAASLAAASNAEVITAWKGMGYNSRALRLRDAAKAVVTEHGRVFPRAEEELRAINGIGPYTASAIRNFAFNLPTPCVDTNIHRILHRVFEGPEPEKANTAVQKRVLTLAGDSLKIALETPGTTAADWHAALMDFGSLVCTKSAPKCEACPLSKGICRSAFRIKARPRGEKAPSKEPGRIIAGTFTPNRIVRGRIVDALREHSAGLTAEELGSHAAADWDAQEHLPWLEPILQKLVKDQLLQQHGELFTLAA